MKPILLEICAFGPYADKQILDFTILEERKFFLIYGPTGAGKTSVLDAMCYALYGATSGDVRSGEAMRSDYASSSVSTYVRFDFAIGEKRYRIERSPAQEVLKKRGVGTKWENARAELSEVMEDGTVRQIAVKDVTRRVEELIGFRCEQFRQVVLLPQGDFRKLLIATSTERQQIMQTLFHTEIYSRIETILQQKAKEIKEQYSTAVHQAENKLAELGVESKEQLEEQIRADQEQLVRLEKEGLQMRQERERAQQAYQQAKELEDHFIRKERSRQTLAMLLTKKEKMEAQAQDLKKLQKALQLKDSCRHTDEVLQKGKALRDMLDRYTAEAAAWEKETAKLTVLQEKLEKEGGQRQKEREELTVLTAVQPVWEAWRLLQAKGAELQAVWQKKEKMQEAAQQRTEKIKKEQTQLQEKKRALSEVVSAAESVRSQWELAKLWKEKERQAEDARKEIEAIAKEDEQAEQIWSQQQEEYRQKKMASDSLHQIYLQGQAAIMAHTLKEGEPCPVCGSCNHPHAAEYSAFLPEWDDVESAQKISEQALQALQEAEKRREKWRTMLQERNARLAELEKEIPENQRSWTEEAKVLEEKAAFLGGKEREKAELEKREEQIQTQLEQAIQTEDDERTSRDKAKLEWEKNRVACEEKEGQIPENYRSEETFKERLRQLTAGLEEYERRSRKIQADKEQAQMRWQAAVKEKELREEEIEERRKEYKAAHADLTERIQAAGFADKAECESWIRREAQAKDWEKECQEYQVAVAKEEQSIQEETEHIGAAERPDMEAAERRRKMAAEAVEAAIREETRYRAVTAQRTDGLNKILNWQKEFQDLDRQYRLVGGLYEVAQGKDTGINFERYVLGALLDEVMTAANERLKEMSRSRYMLQRSETREDRRSKAGLDIAVFDNYTGYARSANTLSGGETFLASLSLALGLADVVQAYAGGIHLDTIFVDEGFGTLDAETLDFALKALLELKEGGRLVGIISHVPELQERIDTRLKITKTDRGSKAAFEMV